MHAKIYIDMVCVIVYVCYIMCVLVCHSVYQWVRLGQCNPTTLVTKLDRTPNGPRRIELTKGQRTLGVCIRSDQLYQIGLYFTYDVRPLCLESPMRDVKNVIVILKLLRMWDRCKHKRHNSVINKFKPIWHHHFCYLETNQNRQVLLV